MEPIRIFIVATQVFCLFSLALGVVGMNRLARFLKIARPETWQRLKFPSFDWLIYQFNGEDMQQVNLRRMKSSIRVNFIFALAFWMMQLAARFGLMDKVIG